MSGKHWLSTTYDNNHLNSSNVWNKGKGGKKKAFYYGVGRKYSKVKCTWSVKIQV